MSQKFKTCLFALLLGVLVYSCEKEESDAKDEQWTIETIDASGSPTSMNKNAADLNGGIHVAYVDENSTSKNKIKYAYKALNGTWQTEFVDDEGNCHNWVDMAVDTVANKVMVVYVKTGQPIVGEILVMAEKSIGTTGWTKTTVQGDMNNSRYPRIAIDKNRGVHICYARGGVGDQYYAYRPLNGSFTVSLLTEDGDANSAITTDDKSNIYIAYYDNDNLNYATKTLSASAWTISSIKTDIDYGASTTSAIQMAFNPSSVLEVLFVNNADATNNISLGSLSGNWSFANFAPIEKAQINSLSMFVRNNGQYVTFRDNVGLSGQHFDLRIAYQLNGTWKTQFVDGNSDNRCGNYNSVYVEKNGKVSITYTADTQKVLKYAYKNTIE